MDLKECINSLKETIDLELSGMQKIEGEESKRFIDKFYIEIPKDEYIYKNSYSIAMTNDEVYFQLKPYLPDKDRVLKLEIPDYNVYLYIYSFFNNDTLNEHFNGSD